MSNPSSGGAFLPDADYVLTGDWDFQGTVTNSGTVVDTGTAVALTNTTNQIATGASSNITTSNYPASSGAVTLTFPNVSTTIVGTTTTNTLTNKTLTAPVITAMALTGTSTIGAGCTITAPVLSGSVTGTYTLAGTPTLTAPAINTATLTGCIDADYKVLAANATYSATVTPATLTGFSWTVVAGTYTFELNMPATMTTVGGLTVNFALTTAVLTSIQYQSYAATADDGGTGISTNGTTTTSGTKVFDSKTAAYTHVNVKGSMVVGTGGTFVWQGTQNTSAGAGDATIVAIGSYARMTRVA